MITGSALNIYSREASVERQIDLAKAVFAAGVPCFGSCWGLQVGVTAAGGSVVRNPRGREFGFARRITLTTPGPRSRHVPGQARGVRSRDRARGHGREPAARRHAAGAQRHGPAGRGDPLKNGGSFWGVQYHPEYSCAEIAAMARRYAEVLIRDGLVKDQAELDALAADLVALDANPTMRGSPGASAWARRSPIRGIKLAELRNWLDEQVLALARANRFDASRCAGRAAARGLRVLHAGAQDRRAA